MFINKSAGEAWCRLITFNKIATQAITYVVVHREALDLSRICNDCTLFEE